MRYCTQETQCPIILAYTEFPKIDEKYYSKKILEKLRKKVIYSFFLAIFILNNNF